MHGNHKCTKKFDIINCVDDTILIATISQVDNHSTGINNNINQERRNINDLMLSLY